MKKIIVFAGSTSKKSINKQLATYAASKLKNTAYHIIDMNNYPAPLYSVDEEEKGFPKSIQQLNEVFGQYDGFIVSLAEHNGSYAAAFKNSIDWVSRLEREVFRNKPVLLLATSPGSRGGATVLEAATSYYPHLGAQITTTFSLPNFYDNFKDGNIVDETLNKKLEKEVLNFETKI